MFVTGNSPRSGAARSQEGATCHGAVLQIHDAFRCSDIVRETRQRFLDDADVVTILFEDVVNSTPT